MFRSVELKETLGCGFLFVYFLTEDERTRGVKLSGGQGF